MTASSASADSAGDPKTDEAGGYDEDDAEDNDDTCFSTSPVATLGELAHGIADFESGDCCHVENCK